MRAAVVAALALVACGSDPAPADGGSDAQVVLPDARIDAPMPIDGGDDAGPDASTASPLAAARDDARESTVMVEARRDAIDAAMRTDVAFLDLDLALVRLDGVIGEKIGSPIGIAGVIGEKSTTAFDVPVAAVIVILRELPFVIAELEGVRRALMGSAVPEEASLALAIAQLMSDVATLQGELEARYDVLVADAASLPGTEVDAQAELREIRLLEGGTNVHAILEGVTSDGSAHLSVDCGATIVPTVRVVDERSDVQLLPPTSGEGPHTFSLVGTAPTRLRIEITDPSATFGWEACTASLLGRRHFRGAAHVLDTSESATLAAIGGDYVMALSALEGQLFMARTEGTAEEMAVATRVASYLARAQSETGRWRAQPVTMQLEDLDVLQLTLDHVQLPTSRALETFLDASTSLRLQAIGTHLAEMRAAEEAALAIYLAP